MESPNQPVLLANKIIAETNANLFLTGKAGTGKTTFLKELKQSNTKRMVVLAPTGVAAINAGGMTIHSFFQLKFGPFLPNGHKEKEGWFRKDKLQIIRTLDLLVIDEISMVRSDVLDAIDDTLRRIRRSHKPFGGVQLLMIGDIEQLPPVVKDEEWLLLKEYYETPYFFSSLALKRSNYLCVELTKVYRQNDENFVNILNKIRNKSISSTELETLNKRLLPPDQYERLAPINICTHNSVANRINRNKLEELDSKKYVFDASIWGNFPEYSYPTEKNLELKEGTQVMFIRNDNSSEKLYFNGKIGTITSISEEGITVKDKTGTYIHVEKCIWNNIKYSLSPDTKEIEETVDGTFQQYPLKIAWAITIHKSQGLTFEHAVIDAQHSFAHGQVYVALSRCKSLDGLFLRGPITMEAVKRDEKLELFNQYLQSIRAKEEHIDSLITEYKNQLLLELFSTEKIKFLFDEIVSELSVYYRKKSSATLQILTKLHNFFLNEIYTVSISFQKQLRELMNKNDSQFINERIRKGGEYFQEKLEQFDKSLKSLPTKDFSDKECEKKVKELLSEYQKEYEIKVATLPLGQHGFSTQNYLKTKTNILLGTLTIKPKEKVQSSHPKLLERLILWRKEVAAKNKTSISNILKDVTIFDLAERIPSNEDNLLQIKKFTPSKVKKYGKEIFSIIKEACFEFGYESNRESFSSTKPTNQKESTEFLTLKLFNEDKNISEIAKSRNLSNGTIENHLCTLVCNGYIPLETFVTKDHYKNIVSILEDMSDEIRLKPIKEQLGEGYSWFEIRCAKEYWEKNQKSN